MSGELRVQGDWGQGDGSAGKGACCPRLTTLDSTGKKDEENPLYRVDLMIAMAHILTHLHHAHVHTQ